MTIEEKINQIIPYQCSNFITYPLEEEGDYRPTVNIWQIYKKIEDIPNPSIFWDKKHFVDITNSTDVHKMNVENAIKCLTENVSTSDEDFFSDEVDCYHVEFSIFNDGDAIDTSEYNLGDMMDKAMEIINYKKENLK